LCLAGLFRKGDKFPYCAARPERENDIYNALGVRRRQDKVPDMSAILPGMMPSKRLPRAITSKQVHLMVQETCIAEWTHRLLSVLGFGCVFIWESAGGWIVSILYALGNLPYIIIQRHNRPRHLRLPERLKEKESDAAAKPRAVFHESDSFVELQRGARI
jgi:glycosyl-4,4'-diaponeurosporenoate acyltransferase